MLLAAGIILSITRLTGVPTLVRAEPAATTEEQPARVAVFDFILPSCDGKRTKLGSLAGENATVLVFVSTECPVSNGYVPTLNSIACGYARRGVALVAINSNDSQSLRQIAEHRREYQIDYPVLKDAGARLASCVQVTHAPEAVVLGPSGEVVYRGRIDDRYSRRGGAAATPRSCDLTAALDQVLAGEPVAVARTRIVGCLIVTRRIESDSTEEPAAGITYSGEIAAILNNHCVRCHRDGGVGPFALTDYEQAAAWAQDIKTFTANRTMPPWLPVDGHGEFLNKRSMTDAEIRKLGAWADAGAPCGDPDRVPETATFSEGWSLGEPDLILEPAEEFHVEADGPDVYRCFVLPTTFDRDMYVKAIEVQPGNDRIVHHVIAFLDTSGRSAKLDQDAPGSGYSTGAGYPGFLPAGGLGGWAPGNTVRRLPEGMARPLPKGAAVVMQVHYHKTGKPETDRTRLGVYFAEEPVTRAVRSILVLPFGARWSGMKIPAGADSHEVTASLTLPRDVIALVVTPHMHLLGKDMRLTATRPDGSIEPLIYVKNWDFDWQESYQFKKPVDLPAGTRLELVAHYDNSEANPRNPNRPPKLVRWGEQTTDEMCIAFLEVAPREPADSPDDLQLPTPGELIRDAIVQRLKRRLGLQ